MPKFKKENKPEKKKAPIVPKKCVAVLGLSRRYTPFPPENHITPSKIDKQIESGEYFLSEKQKKERASAQKRAEAAEARLVQVQADLVGVQRSSNESVQQMQQAAEEKALAVAERMTWQAWIWMTPTTPPTITNNPYCHKPKGSAAFCLT